MTATVQKQPNRTPTGMIPSSEELAHLAALKKPLAAASAVKGRMNIVGAHVTALQTCLVEYSVSICIAIHINAGSAANMPAMCQRREPASACAGLSGNWDLGGLYGEFKLDDQNGLWQAILSAHAPTLKLNNRNLLQAA